MAGRKRTASMQMYSMEKLSTLWNRGSQPHVQSLSVVRIKIHRLSKKVNIVEKNVHGLNKSPVAILYLFFPLLIETLFFTI